MKIVLHILPTLLSVILLAGGAGEHETPAVSQGAESSVSSGVSQARPAPQESPVQQTEINPADTPPIDYNTYFSVERPLILDNSPDDNFFVCSHSIDNKELSVTDQQTGVTFRPVAEPVENYWRFGDTLYIQGAETGIIEYDLRSRASEILYPHADITSLHFSLEVAFFQRGSALYRFYVPTRTEEIVLEDDEIYQFEPLSNQQIRITKYNPVYVQYATETGDWSNAPNYPEYIWFTYDIPSQEMTPYVIEDKLKEYYEYHPE